MSIDFIIAFLLIIVISVFCEYRVKISEDNVKIMDKRDKRSQEKIIEMAKNGKAVLSDYIILVKILEEHFDNVNEMYIAKKKELRNSDKSIDEYFEEIKVKYKEEIKNDER